MNQDELTKRIIQKQEERITEMEKLISIYQEKERVQDKFIQSLEHEIEILLAKSSK